MEPRQETTPRWLEIDDSRLAFERQPEWLFALVEQGSERVGLWLYRGKPVALVPIAQA